MRSVEAQVGNSFVTLDTSSLLKTRGKVLRHLAENGNLALDDFLLAAVLHVSRYVADEASLGTIVKHLLPEVARSGKVLGPDLRQECNCLAREVAVRLVQVKGTLAELDGLDR